MKIYVATKAKLFGDEIYLFAKGSKKAAEKALREQFPYMRSTPSGSDRISSYTSDRNNSYLLFIREEEI